MKSLHPILTALVTMLVSVANAQTDFRPGFIINNGGDTLFGQLDYRGDALMGSICKFKTADDKVQEFKPTDIQGYRFTDSKYFVSKEVDGKKVFLEYLIKGKVNVYYLRDDKGDHYYIDKEGLKLIELPYDEGIKMVDEKQVYYQSNKHYGILSYYMQDVPEIQPQIQGIKEPKHQNLIRLAENYNNMVCKDEKCIIYVKKGPGVKVLIETNVGIRKFRQYDALLNELGGLLYLSIPRTNEKLFFNTGFTYGFSSKNDSVLRVYRIPLQLMYLYRVYKIQPKVGGGMNIWLSNNLTGLLYTLSLSVGVDYKMTEKLALTSMFNTGEFLTNFSYAFHVGVRFDIK